MKNFNNIKNAIGGFIILAVCITAIFSVSAMFGSNAPPETLEEKAAEFVMYFFCSILSLMAALGLVLALQNLFSMYAEKTGIENHGTALKAFEIAKILLTLSIQLIFWSAFVGLGLIAAMPSLFPFEVEAAGGNESGLAIIGWVFIAGALGAAVFAVIKTVKLIKRAIESYSFDKYALPPEEMPEQSAFDNNYSENNGDGNND